MPKSTHKKLSSQQGIMSALANLPDPHRAGLPMADSVTGVTIPTAPVAAAPGALATRQYTIIHTNEIDAYEPGAMGPGLAAARLAPAPVGDNFAGTARKAAKLSISAAKTQNFKDVKDLVKSLTPPPESKMIKHIPPIGTGATSKRVKEEERNVHVTAFMYAASREADNDFHLIIGRHPKAAPEMYMTMELSGLPPTGSPSLPQLKAARAAFKKFFNSAAGGKLPGLTYDFYDPPVPVQIDGSLFFDMSHAKGQRPGPPSLKSRMPVIWEVHPITKIVLK